MSETYNLTVDESNAAKRLDKIVVDLADGITRSAAQRLIDGGNVTVNGETKNKNYISRLGDEIGVTVPDAVPLEAKAENIPLDIVYEDDDLLVVNKPKGMVVHPANGNWEGTLVNALLYHCKNLSGINGVIRPGIVHRLDKDTSGIMICAKNDAAHLSLSQQIQAKTAQRT